MLRVGLTGGIGSGKSTVSALLADRGAVLVDADRLAREVVTPGSAGLLAVVAALGEHVLGSDGSLDRAAVAARVFADPAARQALEGVVHPLVRARAAELEAAAVAADPAAVVVHDVPLLVETGQQTAYDEVVVVDVPPEVQLGRLVARGMPEDEARSRCAAQTSRERRLAAATVVLDNAGDRAALEWQVDALWRRLAARARFSGRPRS